MSDISSEPGRGLGRRQFLHKAALAGGVAWVVPTIVTMQPARAAELTSPPPETDGGTTDGATDGSTTDGTSTDEGGTGGGSTDDPEVGGIVVVADPTDPADPAVGGTQVAGRVLARTGADLDDLVVAGLAATAGGAALLLWRADTQQ